MVHICEKYNSENHLFRAQETKHIRLHPGCNIVVINGYFSSAGPVNISISCQSPTLEQILEYTMSVRRKRRQVFISQKDDVLLSNYVRIQR
jgi:hypothetical protein